MEKAIRILLGTALFAVIIVRIIYCCIVHADEVFSKKPLKETY